MKYFIAIICMLFASQLHAEEEMILRVYAIQDLMYSQKEFADAPKLNMEQALARQNNIFAKRNKERVGKKKNYEQIISIIKRTIEPEIWYDGATIEYFDGKLLIFAPERIHKQL